MTPDGPPQLVRARVFISYSHSDRETAQNIGMELVKAGHEIWLDLFDMKPGDSLIEKISSGIKEASYLLVLLSNASVNSEWVKKELEIAITRQINKNHITVIPCLLQKCEIPIFLSSIMYADFTSDFTEGMSSLLPTIELVDAVAAGRLTDGKPAWIHDWTVDWGLPRDGRYFMNFIIMSWYGTEEYSCYCFVETVAKDVLAQRLEKYPLHFAAAKFFFMGGMLIDLMEAEKIKNNGRDTGIWLDDATEAKRQYMMVDTKTQRHMAEITVRARRLGKIGRKSLVYYYGDLMKKLLIDYCETLRSGVSREERAELLDWQRANPLGG